MKKHGIPVPPPPLAAKQKAEIRECFDMMDTDGSGAIDVGEIVDAFSAIGERGDAHNAGIEGWAGLATHGALALLSCGRLRRVWHQRWCRKRWHQR